MSSRSSATLLGLPYPVPSSPGVSAQMRGNRHTDTKPEKLIRSALHGLGYRFRKEFAITEQEVRVRADIAFPRQRIAVFIDGCFWHRCPDHGNSPRANREYWQRKLDRNVTRDERVSLALTTGGWLVLRIWEHTPVLDAVSQVTAALTECGQSHRPIR